MKNVSYSRKILIHKTSMVLCISQLNDASLSLTTEGLDIALSSSSHENNLIPQNVNHIV